MYHSLQVYTLKSSGQNIGACEIKAGHKMLQ